MDASAATERRAAETTSATPPPPLVGGIDLGGTKIQAAVVDAEGRVHGDARRPTPTEGGPEDVVAAMVEATLEAAQKAGVDTSRLGGLGVGAPGSIDASTGALANASNLPNWKQPFPLAQRLSEALDTGARLGNDVQVATDAEARLGAGQPYRSLIGVFWGTGVGGGIVLDDRPWLGRGAAGEIGHMVIKRGGARCPCGRRGCMEAYAGRRAMEAKARREHEAGAKTDLFKIAKERGRDRLTSGVWERAIERDDPMAHDLIDRAVKALGAGIASAVNLLDVDAVIIGGGLGVRFGAPYAKRIETQMHEHLFAPESPPAVHVAALGDFGGAIGASLLWRPAPSR